VVFNRELNPLFIGRASIGSSHGQLKDQVIERTAEIMCCISDDEAASLGEHIEIGHCTDVHDMEPRRLVILNANAWTVRLDMSNLPDVPAEHLSLSLRP
jgi:hypothetical protein